MKIKASVEKVTTTEAKDETISVKMAGELIKDPETGDSLSIEITIKDKERDRKGIADFMGVEDLSRLVYLKGEVEFKDDQARLTSMIIDDDAPEDDSDPE